MATDQTEERASLLRDMNGNALREGDLVMVLLEKPVLVGFISEIKEPSVLTTRDKNPPGVLTVTGTIKIPFAPNQLQILRQTAKLVDPRAEGLINAITDSVNKGRLNPEQPIGVATIPADIKLPTKKEPVVENPTGSSLVPESPTVDEAKS